MSIEVKIPQAGESIQEVYIGQWLKQEGDWVERDEVLVELETDKASLDLTAPQAGLLDKVLKKDGEPADIGEVVAILDERAKPADAAPSRRKAGPLPEPRTVMPAAQRLLAENSLQAEDVESTGPGGRLLKEDVLRHLASESMLTGADLSTPSTQEPEDHAKKVTVAPIQRPLKEAPPPDSDRPEELVPMTLIRRRIADRLVQAQHEAALLTTFNEIDMSAVQKLRKRHQETFQQRYGIKLGLMSFFVKASIEALKRCPEINAEIQTEGILYRNYFDIGVAIGSGRGLIVPVLRQAELMSFAEIETRIADFATRAQQNKIRPNELEGGTFTITNGGVYGSLLSTPIVNPPQSGVLGLHAIQERPIAMDGKVVIRPMMYIALTYDHRIVDGREAVGFLRCIKDIMEDPPRMLLEL